MDEKKKTQSYIQPPHPKVKETQVVVSEKVEVKNEPKPYPSQENGNVLHKPEEVKVAEAEEPIKPETQPEVQPEPNQKTVPERNAERISALSLKSIQQKRELLQQHKNTTKDTETLPEDAFSEADLQTAWHEYAKILQHKGERIIASHLDMVLPTADNNIIQVTYPNESIKIELERAQQSLLNFLSKKLNNYSLTLQIDVNESEQRNYVYTPKERFDKLREKYPIMDKIKKTFDLDI